MLSPEVTAQLLGLLNQRRDELLERGRTHAHPPERDAPQIGPAAHMVLGDDSPEAEMISDDEARLVGHDDEEIDAIDFQLARLEIGEADICLECGARIPPERLLATPTARTCINCQREMELEKRRAHPGEAPTM